MSTRGVCYMLTGAKHGAQLAVGVYALRLRYHGPVALIAGNEAGERICRLIDEDPRSGDTTVIRWDAPTGGGKGLQHCNKTRLTELMPFQEAVFLDCDTLVVGDFEQLFPRRGTEEVVLTQFADWWSNGRKIKARTEPYREVLPVEVARCQAARYPAINTGTFGISKRSKAYVRRWQEGSQARPKFMCDELVAQVIFPDFPHRVLGEIFNCSPIFSWPRHGPPCDANVRIWHGHGWKFITRPQGRAIWMPYYEAAVHHGFARLGEWATEADGKLRKVLSDGSAERGA